MDKILVTLKRNWTYLAGGLVGGIGGYIYWLKVGCTTGTCPLQATPTATIIWGTIAGMLVFSLFKKKQ